MTTLGLRGPSLLLSPLCARTRARDAYNGRLSPLRPEWLKKVAWAGQKATLQKRSRRGSGSCCPAQARPNVATRGGVRSTLCLIRSSFSDEKRGGNAPIFLRKLSGFTRGHSPFAYFATPDDFGSKPVLDRRAVERCPVGRGWRSLGLSRAAWPGAAAQRVALPARSNWGLCLVEILDGEWAFLRLEFLRKKSASKRPHSPFTLVSNAARLTLLLFLRSKRPSRSIFVLSSNKRYFSLNGGECPGM